MFRLMLVNLSEHNHIMRENARAVRNPWRFVVYNIRRIRPFLTMDAIQVLEESRLFLSLSLKGEEEHCHIYILDDVMEHTECDMIIVGEWQSRFTLRSPSSLSCTWLVEKVIWDRRLIEGVMSCGRQLAPQGSEEKLCSAGSSSSQAPREQCSFSTKDPLNFPHQSLICSWHFTFSSLHTLAFSYLPIQFKFGHLADVIILQFPLHLWTPALLYFCQCVIHSHWCIPTFDEFHQKKKKANLQFITLRVLRSIFLGPISGSSIGR